ncbi:hypothetical protein ACFLZQ_04145 [Thermodesulfobacteriota bacterium]
MKKLLIVAIALVVVIAGFQQSYAKTYWRTYEVAEIQSNGIVLMDFEGNRFLVKKDPGKIKGGLQVGDSVRYDSVKNVLKKNPWQPAAITEITDNTITLELNSGEKVDVNMRSKYRNEFNKGDQVFYNASKKQLKNSTVKEVEQE